MDVRCEKCGTEYELEESRLKPGGVTVKCTHCGHMFKIRKRTAGASAEQPSTMLGMPKPPPPAPAKEPAKEPKKSAPVAASQPAAAAAGAERQWLIRLENGETRSCRELATLQQWIIGGEVTRDALISRSGKTWKLLGDIVELGTYFAIADEARNQRSKRESAKHAAAKRPEDSRKPEDSRTTLVGVGAVSSGSMALGDLDDIDDASDNDPTVARRLAGPSSRTAPMHTAADDAHSRSTAPHSASEEPATIPVGMVSAGMVAAQAAEPAASKGVPPTTLPGAAPPKAPSRPSVSPPVGPPMASPAVSAPIAAASGPHGIPAQASAPTGLVPQPAASPSQPVPAPPIPAITAPGIGALPAVAAPVPRSESVPWTGTATPAGPTATAAEGPMVGRFANVAVDEPAFAASKGPRPPAQASMPFSGGAKESSAAVARPSGSFGPDDDHGPAVAPRGSRAGLWIAIASLVVIAGGFAVVYLMFLRPGAGGDGEGSGSGSALVVAPADAGAPPTPDAAVAAVDAAAPIDAAAPPAEELGVELAGNVEARMRAALSRLGEDAARKDDPLALAARARLTLALAQAQLDRADALPASERAAADKLRQGAKALVLEAVPLAQRAHKAAPAEATANLAMAELLRMQGKPAREVRRYLDTAKAGKAAPIELAVIDALLLIRDGKLAEARKLLTSADTGAAALEQSGDVRLRLRAAVAALADGKPTEARGAVDAVLAAQPEHEVAKALLDRLERTVADTDPLPPEEVSDGSGSGGERESGTGGETFEKLVERANKLAADGACRKAIPIYDSALEKVPNGVNALVGLGFCYIETKQFSSAHSKFRTALSVHPRHERAMWGQAQLYQEQDNRPRAIEAYREYLEAFPGSAAAKRQLERLGASTDDGSGATPPPAPEPKDPPPSPEPPKEPEPKSEPATKPE